MQGFIVTAVVAFGDTSDNTQKFLSYQPLYDICSNSFAFSRASAATDVTNVNECIRSGER